MDERRPVLIAGFGNVLRGDDGFGAAVVALVERDPLLAKRSRAIDVGIAGLGLIRELLDGYSGLIVIDAVDRGRPAGTVYILDVHVPSPDALADREKHALAADMHAAIPDRALLVAAAAGVLPPRVCIVGCQPAECDEFCTELSAPVRQAVPRAIEAVRALVAQWTDNEAVHG